MTGLGLATVLLAGCALGPAPARPELAAPAAWKETAPAAADVVALPADAWWRIFGDPELDALATQVAAANTDLAAAAGRLAEARALARVDRAGLFPSLTAGSVLARRRAPGESSPTTNDFNTGFDLGYEIDLWGRVRHGASAAAAEAGAAAHDLAAVRLAVTAEAARLYWQLRSLDAERVVIGSTLALRRDAAGLQETRHQAGLINEMDVARSRAEVASVEAELHAADRARARLEHALAVLAGQPPSAFALTPHAGFAPPPVVPAGLPSTLLERRPDLAAAELRLDAAGERIAVARADFLPRISLTGSAGLASPELGSLLESGSRTWSLVPGLNLPVFDGGRNRAQLEAARARYTQAAAAWEGRALQAFREVEDALSDLATLSAQGEAVGRALAAARDTAALATERYRQGLTSYLDVVDAQREVFAAERQVVQLRGEQAVSTVLLAKALGGGWENPAVVAAR